MKCFYIYTNLLSVFVRKIHRLKNKRTLLCPDMPTSRNPPLQNNLKITYNKYPRSAVTSELKCLGLQKWQSEWDNTNKGTVTKTFFQKIKDRLARRLQTNMPARAHTHTHTHSGPGFWNILYNSLLNMDFTHHIRVIAFADDLLVLTRGKCAVDAENYANQDLKKI